MKRIVVTVAGLILVWIGTGLGAPRQPESEPPQGGPMGPTIRLPAPDMEGGVPLEQTLAHRRSHRHFRDEPLTLAQVSQILWAAQGARADRRGRTAPSAGATYPLETYLVAGKIQGVPMGVYRYDPVRHRLEPIQPGDLRSGLSAAALGQRMLSTAPATIVLAAHYERTAGRYGDRARRYVHMEIGHAGQNIYLQVQALELGTVSIGAFHDAEVKALLRIPAEPLYLMPIGRGMQ